MKILIEDVYVEDERVDHVLGHVRSVGCIIGRDALDRPVKICFPLGEVFELRIKPIEPVGMTKETTLKEPKL